MTHAFSTWLVPALSLAVGCSASGASKALLVGNSGGGEGGGGMSGGTAISVDDSGATPTLSAEVEENHVTINIVAVACVGDCVDIQAVAAGGFSPYSYSWEDGSKSALRRVCPTQGIIYSVTVTDAGSSSGEFQRSPKSASVSLPGRALACNDAGTPPSTGGAPSTDGGAAESPTVYWVNWASVTPGAPGAGTGTITLPSQAVSVTFAGEATAQSQTATAASSVFAPATTYTSATVANGPPNGGMIALSGSANLTQTLQFSAPVKDPLIAVWSVGFGSLGISSTWRFEASPVVVSSGPSTSWPFAAPFVISGDDMTCDEGNGVVEFKGTFTTLRFTVPTPEPSPGYGGFTMGVRGKG